MGLGMKQEWEKRFQDDYFPPVAGESIARQPGNRRCKICSRLILTVAFFYGSTVNLNVSEK